MQRAISLAQSAELEGNLPIGSVIILEGKIVAEGKNAIWVPKFDATRHAEMQALRAVPAGIWNSSRDMELYTTLDPCLMCFGSIIPHRIGKIHYGSADGYGGASSAFGNLPLYFEEGLMNVQWLGPILPTECDPLYDRVMDLVEARRSSASSQS